MPDYIVYGGSLSYFTRKLEAALHFYGIAYERRAKAPEVREEVEQRSGTHQVPVLRTPENWMLGDTSPIMMLLDGRYPARRMYPPGPLGVLVHVLEEFFDEWVPRTAVHWRWHYPSSTQFAAREIAKASIPSGDAAAIERAATNVANWGPRACRATGTDSQVQQRAAEDEYVRVLTAAEQQLQRTRYLLGDRPCAVDAVVLGGLRAHFNMDPDPKQVVARFPKVKAWSETGADRWDGGGELAPFPDSTPFAQMVLTEMTGAFVPFALANGAAVQAGAKACTATVFGEAVSYLARTYPEQSRRMVRDRIAHGLDGAGSAQVRNWLRTAKLDALYG